MSVFLGFIEKTWLAWWALIVFGILRWLSTFSWQRYEEEQGQE